MLIFVEILIPLLVGLAISLYLHSVLRKLLIDLCSTAERSDFWVRLSTILITAFPVLLSLWFGQSSLPAATLAEVLRATLIATTTGIVIGVAVMGWNISKSIPRVAR